MSLPIKTFNDFAVPHSGIAFHSFFALGMLIVGLCEQEFILMLTILLTAAIFVLAVAFVVWLPHMERCDRQFQDYLRSLSNELLVEACSAAKCDRYTKRSIGLVLLQRPGWPDNFTL